MNLRAAGLLSSVLASLLVPALLLGLLSVALVLGLGTDSGRRLLVWGMEQASGGRLMLSGLTGSIPFAPRFERLELHDAQGVWLVVEGGALSLAPRRLWRGEVAVESLTAEAARLVRRPEGLASAGGPSGFPLTLSLGQLAIAELDLAPVFPGAPALALKAEGALYRDGRVRALLDLQAQRRPDRYRLEASLTGSHWQLTLRAREEAGGLVNALLGSDRAWVPPDLGGWRLEARAAGPSTALDLSAVLDAGPMRVSTQGLVDLESASAPGLRILAQAPAMSLAPWGRPGIAWRHLSAQVDLSGPWTAPRGEARIDLDGLVLADAVPGRDSPGWRFDRLILAARGDATGLDLTGEMALSQAPAQILALLGRNAAFGLSARPVGDAWWIDWARFDGERSRASAKGMVAQHDLALGWALDLPDLGALAPGWSGQGEVRGWIGGDPRAPDVVADLSAAAARGGFGQGRVSGRLDLRLAGNAGGPSAGPAAGLDLRGHWEGLPLVLRLAAGPLADAGIGLSIADARLAGTRAWGHLGLRRGAVLPQGELQVTIPRLADLAPLFALGGGAWATQGTGLAGRLGARLELTDAGELLIAAQGEGLTLPGTLPGTWSIAAFSLDTSVSDPLGEADIRATLALERFGVGSQVGNLSLSAQGPAAALDLKARADLDALTGPIGVDLTAGLDLPGRRLRLRHLEAQIRGERLRLLDPAQLSLADGVSVDRLRLGLGSGSVDLSGRLTPPFDLTADLADLPLDLVRLAAPTLPLTGTLGARMRLSGPLNGLTGSLDARFHQVRLSEGPGLALPPAGLDVSATLDGGAIGIDARGEVGPRTRLRLHGRIHGRPPLAPGALDLNAEGRMDLALLAPLLSAGGRQLSGQANLAATIAGTIVTPRLGGSLRLAEVVLRDRNSGLALTDIAGTLRVADDRVRVDGFSGQAGPGRLTLEGEIGWLVPERPLDLRLVGRRARPIQLDLLEVEGDLDLRLTGRLQPHPGRRAEEGARLAGSAHLSRVEIRLPQRLPASVARLDVRERGTPSRRSLPSQPQPRVPLNLGLDLHLSAPRSVFVSGRGVYARLGGQVHLGGDLSRPQVSGGFDLVRGEYDLMGETLSFNRGHIGFDGAQGMDPTLDLEARVNAADGTAILRLVGTARAPRIELSGEPEMPQDEVLSRLLFGVAGGRLSPFQAARLGVAAASFAGIGPGLAGDGEGLLERLRSGIGLDLLSGGGLIGGLLEGGRYLGDGLYLGARQGSRTGEPQGVLRMEISPHLRLEADVGAAGGTRAGAAWEREY